MVQRPARASVEREQTWDLEGLYPGLGAWEADLRRVDELLPRLAEYKERLHVGPSVLLACIRQMEEIEEIARRVDWFAYNRLSEDQGDPERQSLADRAGALSARVGSAAAFFNPEVLALPAGRVDQYLQEEPGLAQYRQKIRELLDQKEHLLGEEAERIIAEFAELMNAPYDIWQNTTNADMQFAPVTDETGTQVPMSLSALGRLLQSPDRGVREAAYESAFRAFDAHKRTIAAAFAAAQKRDVIVARLRRYPSSLAAALDAVRLPETLFTNLLTVAEAGSAHLRRYFDIRRRALKLDQLQPWDLQAPLDADLDSSISFAEASRMVMDALAPMGREYRAVLEQAFRDRWIDWADNAGKASGAYSASSYGYHPVIMLNWQGKIGDAFTLAHELGHSVHSVFSQKTQPFTYGDYSLFLAEMASTTNEILLAEHLLKTTSSPDLRRYVLTRALGAFTGNFFGASIMAALQLAVHQMVERRETLTYERVTEANRAIFQRYYGDAVVLTEGLAGSWLRPPHHFFNYYAYQYATGISAAAAFATAILAEGEPAVQRYLGFLKAGSSAYPLEILQAAGLDMTTPEPLEQAVAYFGRLVDELERSLS